MAIVGRAHLETWAYAKPFVIARGVLVDAELLVVEISDGAVTGRGEACPVPYFGATPEGELAKAKDLLANLSDLEAWPGLHDQTPPGAARNAVDCAIWDLRAKISGQPVWRLMDQPAPAPVRTVYTVGIDTPEGMAEEARRWSGRHGHLKVKLGDAAKDADRIRAVRAAVPTTHLIVDVNEAWSLEELKALLPVMQACGVELIEQPLKAGQDNGLAGLAHSIPIGADESCFVTADLDRVASLYDVINIKLDKSGGLTEAMRMVARAKALGLDVMVGCMMATSLGIAPATLVAQHCRFVDLDGPLMLKGDRDPPLIYRGDEVVPPASELWG